MTIRDWERTIRFVCDTCLRVWISGDAPPTPERAPSRWVP